VNTGIFPVVATHFHIFALALNGNSAARRDRSVNLTGPGAINKQARPVPRLGPAIKNAEGAHRHGRAEIKLHL
jgi:hypothetical protein